MTETTSELMERQSVTPDVARNLATTTKTRAQITGITPRWLLHLLPWVGLEAGTYRVNRRRVMLPEDERITTVTENGEARILSQDLRALSLLKEVGDPVIDTLANAFKSEKHSAGTTLIEEDTAGDRFFVIVSGKVEVTTTGAFSERQRLAVLGEGDYFGELALLHMAPHAPHQAGVEALTEVVVLALHPKSLSGLSKRDRAALDSAIEERQQIRTLVTTHGERDVALLSGHEGEPDLPQTLVDYEVDPREYSLKVIHTILRAHTRVTDLYNNPIDQLGEQVRHAIEAVKERQEWDLINDPEIGLLRQPVKSMRVHTRRGAPTPDDVDELLSRVWKRPAFFLAHPAAIAAFGRECTARGVPPPTVQMLGSPFITWRGVPLVPTDKLLVGGRSRPIEAIGETSILLVRVGEQEQGVVGLHQPGVPGEVMPSLSVRKMKINRQGVAEYLLSLYFSLAVLADDAVGVLEGVQVGNYHD